MVECSHFRGVLLEDQHGRLAGESARELHAHLRQCASCAELDRADRWLIEVLRARLPRPHALDAFRKRLVAELSNVRPPLGAAVRERGWSVLNDPLQAGAGLAGFPVRQEKTGEGGCLPTLKPSVGSSGLKSCVPGWRPGHKRVLRGQSDRSREAYTASTRAA